MSVRLVSLTVVSETDVSGTDVSGTDVSETDVSETDALEKFESKCCRHRPNKPLCIPYIVQTLECVSRTVERASYVQS